MFTHFIYSETPFQETSTSPLFLPFSFFLPFPSLLLSVIATKSDLSWKIIALQSALKNM
jgi:hypothetical protein